MKLGNKHLISTFLIIPVSVYIGLMVFAHSFADSMIFQPQPSFYVDDDSIIKLRTENGQKISARHLKNQTAHYTILFSHGNAEDIGTSEPFLKELQKAGFAVLAYDYRGYGTSEGTPSEENSYQDIETAYDYLVKELNIPAEKIIIHGRSLGGAVSIDLAARKKCGGLIVESSFVSAFRVLTGYKIFPFDKFQSISKIKNIECPILIIHGKKDELIPFWHGEALFEAAREPKTSFWIEGANHNDVFQVSGDRYLDAIKGFAVNKAK